MNVNLSAQNVMFKHYMYSPFKFNVMWHISKVNIINLFIYIY